MSSKRKRGDSWEFTVKVKKVREKPFVFTFEDEEEGQRYCDRLEALLRSGVVPPELIEPNKEFVVIGDVIKAYMKARAITEDDEDLLGATFRRVGSAKLSKVDYAWCEHWIKDMKVDQNLKPSTIRHYVGALARCFDWGSNRRIPELAVNPLRLLPKGYSSYNAHDAASLSGEREVQEDEERDRRLEEGEEERIRAIMDGAKPEGKERAFAMPYRAATECLFDLALETAMRMRECYTLRVTQVDFAKRTIFLEKTKNGSKRQVPMSSVAMAVLKRYMAHVENGSRGMEDFSFEAGLLFPWWDGDFDKKRMRAVTAILSQQFARIFDAAKCGDLRFHDLRHEATSRLFERTQMSDGEIMKITGHRSAKMLMRYANLRGSNLADKLW